MIVRKTIRHAHLYCGSGGGGKGFNRAQARVGNYEADFECIGGIDVDPAACRDFTKIVGTPATCIDLFSIDQYIAFHGKAPPAGWREATPDDIRRAYQGKHPHILFLSAPCKGFSGLLSEKVSSTAKYQALNELTLRGIWLALEAYKDDPIELIVFENVPRIATRGRFLLDQICPLLRAYGYAVAETSHDCGEIGNLAQSRKRFLLVARHAAKIPCFLYEPIKHKLRGVGEVLDKLPLPLSGLGGPMHRMPALHWKTWVRLAFVEAGSDWRSLNKLNVEDGTLLDFGIAPDHQWARASVLDAGAHAIVDPRVEYGPHNGALGVKGWAEPSSTVASRVGPTNGSFAVADPRAPHNSDRGAYGVGGWDDPAGTVTSQRSPGQGKFSVADPRITDARRTSYGVRDWSDPSVTVRGEGHPTNGAFAVSDPRVDGHPKSVQLGVRNWSQPAGVVTGKMFAGGGPNSVADPRIAGKRFNTTFRIVRWNAPSPAVAGPGGPAGGLGVADPRAPGPHQGKGKYRITAFGEHAGTVIGASTTGQGAFALADPRYPWTGAHENKMAVRAWEGPAKTVTGSDRVGSGAQSVADPRPVYLRDGREHYVTAGNYGVLPYDHPSGAVAAHGQHDNGRWSVADPRALHSPELINSPNDNVTLPAASDRLVCVIIALDGTWHRPFTTYELAAIQSLVDPDEDLVLDGLSDSAWRERIGNMVPPAAAEAIGGVCGVTLLASWSGQTFMMGSTPIWVRPVAAALMAAE